MTLRTRDIGEGAGGIARGRARSLPRGLGLAMAFSTGVGRISTLDSWLVARFHGG